ncbi:ABC transporter permease subunit [Sulfurihydrogenibium azorense]|uniref:ABC transporter permease subunit n=1 Tax=Sulfurihydrogenibium azorense TaxID=309806 RepID=UPI00240A61A9|nr:ABC transporter permease subunit [Sulfurihydrogenibium azorense]MDM7273124.1 ABC transporter permease subunit [Sulfurihydrogenibium azorense]
MFVKLLKYEIYNITRSFWILFYTVLVGLIEMVLLKSSDDLDKVVVSLTNIDIIIVPLISLIFSLTYFYSNRQFIEVLLTQPINRKVIYLSDYFSVALSLSLAFGIGSIVPFAFYGYIYDKFIIYFFSQIILTFIFTSIGYFIAILNDDRVVGIGVSLILWFFFLVIFDSLIFYIVVFFSDYPIEKFIGFLIMFNPLDLVRIYIFYNLGLSELLGVSGIILSEFIQKYSFFPIFLLLGWNIIFINLSLFKFLKKDF